MQTTTKAPECPQCIEHDAKTKSLLHELFSIDELRILCLLAGNSLQGGMDQLAKMPSSDMKTLMMKRDLDFMGAVMGKLYVGLNDLQRQQLIQTFRKMKVTIQVTHEVCPHLGKEVPQA